MHRHRWHVHPTLNLSQRIVIRIAILAIVSFWHIHAIETEEAYIEDKKDAHSIPTNSKEDIHNNAEMRRSIQLRWNLGNLLFDVSFEENEDAGMNDGVQLVDSTLKYMGRVEIVKSDRTWGTICGDGWTIEDATVVCRQLGFLPSGVMYRKNSGFGHGEGVVSMAKVNCRGDEKSLENCTADRLNEKKSLPCSKYMKGASVTCGCPLDESEYVKSKCFLYSGYFSGSLTCHYSCPNGMIMVGDRIRTCNEKHTWTGVKPYCLTVSEPRGVCQISSQNRKSCLRNLSSPSTRDLSAEECISLGCCHNSSAVPRCYLPADSPCMLNKCGNGAECRDRLGSDEYECICTDKFGGRNCQYDKHWSCGIQQIKPNLQKMRRFRRVVGGRKATPGSWPWIVRIKRKGNHICGGTLIHPRWVLTAAHCFSKLAGSIGAITVSVGGNPEGQLHKQDIKVMRIKDANYTKNVVPTRDIALIKLDRAVEISRYADILCLPRSHSEKPAPGSKCWIAGWGNSGNDKDYGSSFSQADIPIISLRNCRAKQDYDNHYYHVTDEMICAGYPEGGIDACNGDSGGPLMCKRLDETWYIAGVVSWGYACGDAATPGVYMRVSSYLNWIYSVIYQDESR